MSSEVFPSRGRCIATDNIHQCQCPSFASPVLDPHICVNCGHGIHAHVDCVSVVVHHYPSTQCAAYVQKTPLTQCCTCEIWLCDHFPTNNLHRSAEPWTVLDYFPDSNSPYYDPAAISYSNGATNDPHTPTFMPFSRDANLVPVHFLPQSPRIDSSSGVGNISLAPATLSSPSAGNASSGNQSDITQAQAYAYDLNDRFVQYPDHVTNDSYARQPDGGTMDENVYYNDHLNVIHDPTSEGWSGRYA